MAAPGPCALRFSGPVGEPCPVFRLCPRFPFFDVAKGRDPEMGQGKGEERETRAVEEREPDGPLCIPVVLLRYTLSRNVVFPAE